MIAFITIKSSLVPLIEGLFNDHMSTNVNMSSNDNMSTWTHDHILSNLNMSSNFNMSSNLMI